MPKHSEMVGFATSAGIAGLQGSPWMWSPCMVR
jgi:hypothetical protein